MLLFCGNEINIKMASRVHCSGAKILTSINNSYSRMFGMWGKISNSNKQFRLRYEE